MSTIVLVFFAIITFQINNVDDNSLFFQGFGATSVLVLDYFFLFFLGFHMLREGTDKLFMMNPGSKR